MKCYGSVCLPLLAMMFFFFCKIKSSIIVLRPGGVGGWVGGWRFKISKGLSSLTKTKITPFFLYTILKIFISSSFLDILLSEFTILVLFKILLLWIYGDSYE